MSHNQKTHTHIRMHARTHTHLLFYDLFANLLTDTNEKPHKLRGRRVLEEADLFQEPTFLRSGTQLKKIENGSSKV